MRRQIGIPTAQLAIFEHIVFIGVGIIHHLVSHRIGRVDGRQRILGVGRRSAQAHPSHKVLLIGCVAARRIAVVVVATAIHQAPVAHAEI